MPNRVIRYSLGAVLSTALLAACGSQASAPSTASSPSSPASAAASSQPAAASASGGASASAVAPASQSAAAGQSPQGAPVTITMSFIAQGHDDMAPLVNDFQKANPNIKVNVQYLPQATLSQATATALQAGNAPDVLYTNGGSGQLISVLTLSKGGYVADLSGQPWVKDIPAAAKDLYVEGSKVWGVPMGLSLVGVLYSPDAFQQMGLQAPTTFSDLVGLCSKIKAAGKVPMALAGQAPGLYALGPAANTVYSSDPNWTAERIAGKVTFANTPGWTTALQEFVDLNGAGCFPPGAAANTIIQASQQLASGQAMMWIAPSAAIASIANAKPDFKVAMMPIPGPTADSTRAVTEYNDSFSVNAHSKNMDAAIKLVDFLAQPEEQQAYAKIEGEISVPDSVTGTLPPQYSAFSTLLKANKAVTLPSLIWPNPAVGTALTPDMQGLLTGQKTVKDVLADLDKAWDSAPPSAAAGAPPATNGSAPAAASGSAPSAASGSAAAKPSASS